MSKVSGSYESVVRGVSEQVPQDRRSGQHFEQVNFISDPVRGLARRHGSLMRDEIIIGDYTAPAYEAMLADTLRHKVTTFYADGVEYDIIYRTIPDTEGLGENGFAWAFNKDTGQFLPINYADDDAPLATLIAGGVSAAVNVGKFLLLAGNTIVPSWTPFDAISVTRGKMVCWVRGGAYSRTFKIILTAPNGTKVTASYKTVSSSYPELLDTTDLLTSDVDYQKKVNDRVNAYNSEVTSWIGTAATDVTPENIASKLKDALVALGVTATVQGGTVLIDDTDYIDGVIDDGGDGSLMHFVGTDITAAELVSTIHWPGKVVKVRPSRGNGSDAFYLEAFAKDKVTTTWTEVSWREGAGYTITPATVFILGAVAGGALHLASTAPALTAMIGSAVPAFKPNIVGDEITCPLPVFFGKRIDYLGLFQDRLVVGSGATLMFSRPGDYFNWFRQSVLTVIDTDPWEGYALGAEEDTIRHSATYDRNVYYYGEKFQYVINGRQQMSPRANPAIQIGSAYKESTDAAPQSSGSFIFYTKYSGEAGLEATSLHQVQPSAVADNPDSFKASQPLDRYIGGHPVEIVAMTDPNTVFIRTEQYRNRIYTYTYLDSAGGERLTDSWSHWRWASTLGDMVGMSAHDNGLLVYMLRQGLDRNGNPKVWIAAERFVLDTGLSAYPYLDSLRPLAATAPAPGPDSFITSASDIPEASIAFRNSSTYRFLGSPLSGYSTLVSEYPDNLSEVWAGVGYETLVTPTNPFVRDRNDKAVLNGRTTLGRLAIAVADTGGLTVDVTTASGSFRSLDFNGRILGRNTNLVGRQPIVTGTAPLAPIGKEVRECSYTIRAKTWLPLTVTAIEWTGQLFNNTGRV